MLDYENKQEQSTKNMLQLTPQSALYQPPDQTCLFTRGREKMVSGNR